VCVSGERAVTFSTRTGEPLGEAVPVAFEILQSPAAHHGPGSSRGARRPPFRGPGALVGHGDTTYFARVSPWLRSAHLEERPLPFPPGALTDAGVPATTAAGVASAESGIPLRAEAGAVDPEDAGSHAAEALSQRVLARDFAITRKAGQPVQTFGASQKAERLLACRDHDHLAPYSACRPAAVSTQ